MDTKGIDQLLSQMNAAAELAAGKGNVTPAAGAANFADVLKDALEQVNSAELAAEKKAEDFQMGKPDANLQEVMVSLQKANLSFQTMVQVRNKLVAAYQDIMNMQV
ncbi:MAG: flagellar hook-basal body complex protein FliE [Methylophilaceae bacterium]|nr:flagellar hook-basal body complex protein FliE [Methylophilaceae bacterium]